MSALVTATDRSVPTAETVDPARRLAALFEMHHQRLFRLARRLAGEREAALDLVQEAFLRAARRPGAVPVATGEAEAWLVRVLVNLCRDRHRRLVVRRRAAADRGRDEARVVDDPEEAAVARAVVWRAVTALPARRRAVVVLCELEGLDSAEAARLLGISRVTVRWHLALARRELAVRLGALPEPGGKP